MNDLRKNLVASAYIQQHEDGHYSAYTDVIIDTSKEKIWKILSDFKNMKKWSSTMVNITGEIKNEGKVQSHFSLYGKIWVADHIFIYEEGSHFGWSDPLTGDFEGNKDNHLFKIEAISPTQSRFIHTDEFTGKNALVHGLTLAYIAYDFYPKFNRELRDEVMKTK